MQKVTLQVPMNRKLRDAALAAAESYGFSSLQELFRVLAVKLADRELDVTFTLSPRAEKRYVKMDEDFRKGKNTKRFSNVDELIKDLAS